MVRWCVRGLNAEKDEVVVVRKCMCMRGGTKNLGLGRGVKQTRLKMIVGGIVT